MSADLGAMTRQKKAGKELTVCEDGTFKMAPSTCTLIRERVGEAASKLERFARSTPKPQLDTVSQDPHTGASATTLPSMETRKEGVLEDLTSFGSQAALPSLLP